MRDTVMPPGTASQTAMPNSASLNASFARISLLRNCRTMSSTHTAGKINRKTAYPVMVSRYFSSIMAHSTIRKSDVRSASFSAMALPVSPGRAETAADAAVEAAVSFITVACFSFKYSMLVRCVSGEDCHPEMPKKQPSPIINSSTHETIRFVSSFILSLISIRKPPTVRQTNDWGLFTLI